MGFTKSVLFDNDPAHDGIRKEWAEERDRLFAEFTVRLATRRKNQLPGRGRWDPLWPGTLHKAADELGIKSVNINDGMFFRTAEDRDRTRSRAEAIWTDTAARLNLIRRD